MSSGRGGNRHPLPTKEFIKQYFREHGECEAVDVFHAYKAKLAELSEQREKAFQELQKAKLERLKELNRKPPPGRRKSKLKPYVAATYNSFMVQLYSVIQDGEIVRPPT